MRPLFQIMFAMVLAPLAAASTARAQQEDPTVYATSYIEVAVSSASQAATLLKQLAEASRKDSGVINFEVAQRTSPSNQFVVLEAWKDQQAYDAHMAAAHTKQTTGSLAALLIAPTDTRLCTQMVGQGFQAASPGAIFGVSHVDVVPPKRDDGFAALVKYSAATRSAAGNLRYYPVREKGRLNHFTVVEIWKDQGSLDAYESAAPSKEFRNLLGSITGALYDRRWYKSL
jgi:quinol monooxygenase YgiN